MPDALTDLNEQIKAKKGELQAAVERKGDDGAANPDTEAAETLTREIKDLYAKRAGAAEDAKAKQVDSDARELLSFLNEIDPSERERIKSELESERDTQSVKAIGQQFIDSDAYKTHRERGFTGVGDAVEMKATLKALFSSTAGWTQDVPRIPRVQPIFYRPVQLLDRIRQMPTPTESVEWMEQTTRTRPPNQGGTAEGAIYQEAAFGFTVRTSRVKIKTAWVPITEVIAADEPQIIDIIQSQLPTMLGEHVDDDLINGDGGTNEMIGLLSLTGRRIRNKGQDESFYEGVGRLLEEVEVNSYGMAMVDTIIMHPSDYYSFMFTQDANLQYMFGLLGQQDTSPWGPTVVKAHTCPRGTIIVGDLARYMYIRDRQSIRTRIAPRWAVTGYVRTDDAGAMQDPLVNGLTAPTGQMMIYSDLRAEAVHLMQGAFGSGTGF